MFDPGRQTSYHRALSETWPRGRRHSPAKGAYGLKPVSRVRIPPSPPVSLKGCISKSKQRLTKYGLFLVYHFHLPLVGLLWPWASQAVLATFGATFFGLSPKFFAVDWRNLQGEKLIDIPRTEDERGSTLQLWMSGVHLTVCFNRQRVGEGGLLSLSSLPGQTQSQQCPLALPDRGRTTALGDGHKAIRQSLSDHDCDTCPLDGHAPR